MANEELVSKLQSMHQQLESINHDLSHVERVDDQTVDLLGKLVGDVGQLVDRAHEVKESNLESDEQSHPIRDSIEDFETEHPRVTQFLAQVSELLASLGI